MKEPLLWFALIGILLFTADSLTQSDPVIVDDTVRNQIATLWETQMGKEPDAAELQSLVNHWVREEIFYREALRLGLDRGDTIVRRRLVQKLEFLAQEVNEDEITKADIVSFYEANLDKYTLPVRYSFSQIYFSDDARSAEIESQLDAGDDWKKLGESSLLPRQLIRKSEREISSTFGAQFANAITSMSPGGWRGPVESTFGFHIVSIDAVAAAEITPLANVEQQVLTDLLHQRQEESLARYYQDLMDQHDVKYL